MHLIDRLKGHLKERARLARDKDGAPADIEIEAAVAVLLLEAAYGDEEYEWREHRLILRALEESFGLGKKETLALLGRANEIRPPVVSLQDVTDVIRDRYDEAQREEVLTLLWEVIDADRVIEEFEEVFADHVARAVSLPPERAREAREHAART